MIKKCFISGLICSVYNVSIGFIHCILQNNKLLGSKVINVSYNNKTVILKRPVLLVEEMRNTRMKQVICPPPQDTFIHCLQLFQGHFVIKVLGGQVVKVVDL